MQQKLIPRGWMPRKVRQTGNTNHPHGFRSPNRHIPRNSDGNESHKRTSSCRRTPYGKWKIISSNFTRNRTWNWIDNQLSGHTYIEWWSAAKSDWPAKPKSVAICDKAFVLISRSSLSKSGYWSFTSLINSSGFP